MEISDKKKVIIFEENVKTSNENRIKLIEDTINFFDQNKVLITIDRYEFYLILDEAISNAMEHGNRWNIEKHVSLCVMEPVNKIIEIQIEDEGNGFDPEIIVKKIDGLPALNPRGRGILIIKKFCDVRWDKHGVIIRMILTLQN